MVVPVDPDAPTRNIQASSYTHVSNGNASDKAEELTHGDHVFARYKGSERHAKEGDHAPWRCDRAQVVGLRCYVADAQIL